MATEIEARVEEIAYEQLNVDKGKLNSDASFVDDLGADSLDIVELVMALEEEYGMEISEGDAEKIKTVGDAVAYIERHASTSAPRGGDT